MGCGGNKAWDLYSVATPCVIFDDCEFYPKRDEATGRATIEIVVHPEEDGMQGKVVAVGGKRTGTVMVVLVGCLFVALVVALYTLSVRYPVSYPVGGDRRHAFERV